MVIDIMLLLNRSIDVINIDDYISFNEDYLKDSEILKLDNVKISGQIILDDEGEPYISVIATGEMILEDSISLDEISYPFSVKIDEKLQENAKNNINSIDIMDILWQNIVLEVPLKLTEVRDLSQYQGDGWKLVSEEELNKGNNPFSNLKDMLREE